MAVACSTATAVSLAFLIAGCSSTKPPPPQEVEVVVRVCDENAPTDECVEVEAHLDFAQNEPVTIETRICDEPPVGPILPPEDRYEEDCIVVVTKVERTRMPLASTAGGIVLGIARFIGAVIGAILPGA